MYWKSENKNNLKFGVSNRVAKIQQTKIQIIFVPGKFIPADLVSKAHPSKQYNKNTFWATGPSCLKQ